ncbi:glucosamine-6-phosphate deaminase [Anaerosolibacter carboniphilus]|uniref:Glucosamine-6-phosphate deaminase n=1 Tax=Anaerosolibacter carboniphilus TaxID=1417629 RepID=A0A841KKJ2_9FIRM|nr:glucosamine-6-phosphate deaminase [Anaerosolibacter carboniphilus]MBB6214384.1 glucosamine-6-phosphate deaminase [Anaerosolibacter carboniphilus]
MRIIIAKDYKEMGKKAANMIASQIILKPESVVGFATGETPVGMYKELVNLYKLGSLETGKITTFNLDEYYGLSQDNPQSYAYYMHENLFKHIHIESSRIHLPDGMSTDIEIECARYEEKIYKAGGIDLQVLGIGRNGHIGFNEPDVKFEARTHMVELDQDTIAANARFFPSMKEVPKQAISMGIKTIMGARKILLLAAGIEKASAIYDAIYGKITPELPASILQLHPDVTMILEEKAASLLTAAQEKEIREFAV